MADSAGAAAPMQNQCTVVLAATNPSSIVLPANAPALLAVERVYGASTPKIDASFVDGATRTELTAVKDSHGLSTLALPSPSSGAGSYSVEVETSCPEVTYEQKSVTALTLTAPVAFPTSIGTLVHVPSDPPTGIDKIRLEPTEGMRAFLPAAQLDLVVGGVKASSLTFVNGQSAIELQVNTGDACIENGALHRDKRIVKVTLDGAIAGVAESPASESLDVTVDCGAIKWTSGVVPPGVDGKPRTGANDDPMPTQEVSSSDAGGCSTAPIGTQQSGHGLIALAIGGVGLVAMRRRRKTV